MNKTVKNTRVSYGWWCRASSVRYRRTFPIFNAYKITTRLVGEKAIYLQQQFNTLADGFIQQCITKINVLERMKEFPDMEKQPDMPDELQECLDSIETSNLKLRKDK